MGQKAGSKPHYWMACAQHRMLGTPPSIDAVRAGSVLHRPADSEPRIHRILRVLPTPTRLDRRRVRCADPSESYGFLSGLLAESYGRRSL